MNTSGKCLSRGRAALLALTMVFGAAGSLSRAAVNIAPVPVPAIAYTTAGAYSVKVEDASNPSYSFNVPTHVHKVRYHRTSDGTPSGTASPLSVPPATSGDLDLVTNVYYTHFSFGGGAVKVTVTFNSVTPTSVTLSPTRYGIIPTLSGNVATFTLTDSRYLILSVNNNSTWPYKLIIIADPLETNAPARPSSQGQNSVWDVTLPPYNADGTYTNAADAAISTAISDVHNAGGGIVYVPAGVYKITSSVIAHSNVSLYLEPGAYLRTADSVPGSGKIYTIDGSGISNFKVYGRGTLDANGVAAGGHQPSKSWITDSGNTSGYKYLCSCIRMQSGCSGITIDGIVLRESAGWTVFLANSDGINITNTKNINYQQDFTYYRENDGLDLISCSNSTVSHSFVFTADDALCMKGGYDSTYTKVLDSCTYNDLVVYSGADGAKYGFQGYTAVQNSTFENIDVVRAARPIAVHVEHGNGLFSNLQFTDVTAEAVKSSSTSRPVDFDLRASEGSDVSNVTVTNFTSPLEPSGNKSYIQGSSLGTFNGVHFINLKLGGTLVTSTNYSTYFTVTSAYVSNLTFAGPNTDANVVLDVAPQSFSSNWKTPPTYSLGIDKINDGDTSSTSEAQALDSNDAWVVWDFGAMGRTIGSAQIYQDNGTYSAQTWKLERKDSTGAWVMIFDFTSCPTAGWNSKSFPTVFTTAVRLTFHPDAANGKKVGINEAQVFGH